MTKQKKRWTIGFLIDYTDSQYQFNILQGISDCAVKHDINLLCFEGGSIERTINFDHERNIIYDLVTATRLDGIIILSDSIAHLLDQDMLYTFTSQFHPLPIISVGRSHKLIHSVVIDSASGMREMVQHLVTCHNYRKFAFIRGLKGSKEADIRYNTFCEMLAKYAIPLNPDLVFEGDYLASSGKRAIRILMDDPGEEVDVIVAANDEMAIGAMTELKIRGIKVPDQIALVGFDDVSKSTTITPSLTTVRQPLHREGWTAVEMLLDILNNKETKLYTELSSGIIIRESCRCNAHYRSNDFNSTMDYKNDIIYTINKSAPDPLHITNAITDILNKIYYDTTWMDEKECARTLTNTYSKAKEHEDVSLFLKMWMTFLDFVFHVDKDAMPLKNILESLYSLSTSDSPPSPAYHIINYRSEEILKDRIIKTIQNQNYQAHNETWIINSFRDELHIHLTMSQVLDVLYENLVNLGINSTYLSLYETTEERKKSTSRLILAFHNKERYSLPEQGLSFPSIEILPKDFYPIEKRFSFIIESINYAANHFGFILFDMRGNINSIFGSLRRIFSNVMHGAHLISHIEDQRNELISSISKLRTTMSGVIQTLALAVEIRDPYTAGHQRRVSDLSGAIARKLGLKPDIIEGICMAGIVHDIGKIYVPAEILNKPGKLMDIEFNLIKHHPTSGYEILKKIDFPWPIADIVLQHHERMDGSGYPNGITKDKILKEAQILTVADVVEAITSMRPYRAALGIDVALEEIGKFKGTRYDTDVVEACISLFTEDNYQFIHDT